MWDFGLIDFPALRPASRDNEGRRQAEGGCTRYLMSDSSMQHSREFEATWLLTVKNCDLSNGLLAANDLIDLEKDCDEHGNQVYEEEDELYPAWEECWPNRKPGKTEAVDTTLISMM